MNAEVSILLKDLKAKQQDAGADPNDTGLYLDSTLQYTLRFAQFTDENASRSVRDKLQAWSHPTRTVLDPKTKQQVPLRLHAFEVAALANLCPHTVEEARTVIPSLKADKISDADLESLLEEIDNAAGTVL
jgi:RNA polymerase Rpb4